MLNKVWADTVTQDAKIIAMRAELKSINESLWDIEDDIRDKERAKRFSEKFVELALSVYVTNDLRADVKKINLHLKSDIVEKNHTRITHSK